MKTLLIAALTVIAACSSKQPKNDTPKGLDVPRGPSREFARLKINQTMQNHHKQFKECAMNSPTKIDGTIKVSFVINPDGSVAGTKLEDSDLQNPAVEKCVLDHVQSIHFDSQPAPTPVRYPISISS